MSPELRTERLLLRRWRDEDRAPFAVMGRDPEVMRYSPIAALPPRQRRARRPGGCLLRRSGIRALGAGTPRDGVLPGIAVGSPLRPHVRFVLLHPEH